MGDDIMEVRQGEFIVSDDAKRLDRAFVVGELQATYWAKDRSAEAILKSADNSLCYGVYRGDEQVAFGRVITDYVTYAYLCDVIVKEAYRGKGLGELLVGGILNDERLTTARFALFTKDAQEFYRKKFGFSPHKFEALVREPRPLG